MEKETEKEIEEIKDTLDQVMLDSRDLDKRVEKLEGENEK